jgi:hypothetical protein
MRAARITTMTTNRIIFKWSGTLTGFCFFEKNGKMKKNERRLRFKFVNTLLM